MLLGLAYRLLGTSAEAEDVVQETYLIWSAANHDEILKPEAWLITVCTRKALDQLKSAQKNVKTTLVCGYQNHCTPLRKAHRKITLSFLRV